jgi:DNA repair photolyase
LSEAGVPCGVFLAPILPGITDSVAAIDAVAATARAHGAVSFGSAALRLAPDVKRHYLAVVAERFPALLVRYERAYTGPNAPADYQVAIERRVAQIRERYGFDADAMRRRRIDPDPAVVAPERPSVATGQLALPL